MTDSVSRCLDALSDLAILGFAAWTVLYHLALLAGLGTDTLLAAWVIVFAAAAIWWFAYRTERTGRIAVAVRYVRPPVALVGAALLLAVVSGLLIRTDASTLWWTGWALGAAAAVVALAAVLRGSADAPAEQAPSPTGGAIGTFVALVTAAGLAAFSIFTFRYDADDVFYVNKAQWVAEHGAIPIRDTLFTNQRLPALSGAGVPVSSIETLEGALAHVGHVAAGTVVYLVTPVVGTFLAVWAIWRLVRAWTPRRAVLCFAVAVTYLLWAGQGAATLGSFFLARMQQGKVIFVAMLVPLLYLYLTRWAENPSRRNALLLLAGGAAAVGFSSSATFLVPLICATAALPLLLRRRYLVAAGSLLALVYPLIVGLVVHFAYASVNAYGRTSGTETALHAVFGDSWLCLISWLAAFGAFAFVRVGAPRHISAGIAVLLGLVLAPGVLPLIADATGAGAVAWRTMWIAPLPVLAGMGAAVPLPRRLRLAAPLPALACIAAVLVAGTPLWAAQRNIRIEGAPTWRYARAPLEQARAIIEQLPAGATVLAPPATMGAIAISTTRIHAVSPLLGYSGELDEPARRHHDRLLLAYLVQGGHPAPTVAQLRAALRLLDVDAVCVPPSWAVRGALFQAAGYRNERVVGHLRCLSPGTS